MAEATPDPKKSKPLGEEVKKQPDAKPSEVKVRPEPELEPIDTKDIDKIPPVDAPEYPGEDLSDVYREIYADNEFAEARRYNRQNAAGLPEEPKTEEEVDQKEAEDFSVTLRSMADDFGEGVTFVSRSVARGIAGAVPDLIHTMADMNDWFYRMGIPGGKLTEATRRDADMIQGWIDDFLPPADTRTGQTVEELSSFFTVFLNASRALKKATSLGGDVNRELMRRGTLAGGIADFITVDPAESMLDFFLEKNPHLRGPIESYLAGNPDDPRFEARLRNGIVGTALGALTDGFVIGLRWYRGARAASKIRKAATNLEEFGISDEALRGGTREGPWFDFKKSSQSAEKTFQAIEEELVSRFGAKHGWTPAMIREQAEEDLARVTWNFRKIDTTADVKEMMQSATDFFSQRINKARGGKQSHLATQRLAEQLGMTVEDLLKRPIGMAGNAAQTTAARQIHVSAANELMNLAEMAHQGIPSQELIFQVRRQAVIFQAINEQVLGLRAEAGRTLNSWNIPMKGNVERAQYMAKIIADTGGEKTGLQFIQLLQSAKNVKMNSQQLDRFLQKGWMARTTAALTEHFVNGLLWSPVTHIVNTLSPYLMAAQNIPERALAEKYSALLGREAGEGVASGEAFAMAYGLNRGIETVLASGKAGFREAPSVAQASGLKEKAGAAAGKVKGIFEGIGETRQQMGLIRQGKTDDPFSAMSARAWRLNEEGALGTAVDWYGSKMRIPGVALAIEDDMGKILGYSMELHAQAYRLAAAGGGTPEQILKRARQIAADPPEHIRLASADSALYFTYQNQVGRFGEAAMGIRKLPGMFYFIPFVRTPINITGYTFERTALAPLTRQFQNAMRKGGAESDIALARMSLGVLSMSAFIDMSYSYLLHGDGPPSSTSQGTRASQMDARWQPNSIQFGNLFLSFQRLDAFGLQASLAGTLGERMRALYFEEEDVPGLHEIFAAASMATAVSVMDKSWFTGLGNILDAVRYEGARERVFERIAGTALLPAPSLFKTIRNLSTPLRPDPSFGSLGDIWQAPASMVAVWESRLAHSRNLDGDLVSNQEVFGSVFETFSPIRVTRLEMSPRQREESAHDMDLRPIRRKTPFLGVPFNLKSFPHVHEAYVKMAGQGTIINGKSWKEHSNEFVQTDSYLRLPPSERRARLAKKMFLYREAAQREMFRRIEEGNFSGPMAEFEVHQDEFDAFLEELKSERVKSRERPKIQTPGEIRQEREEIQAIPFPRL